MSPVANGLLLMAFSIVLVMLSELGGRFLRRFGLRTGPSRAGYLLTGVALLVLGVLAVLSAISFQVSPTGVQVAKTIPSSKASGLLFGLLVILLAPLQIAFRKELARLIAEPAARDLYGILGAVVAGGALLIAAVFAVAPVLIPLL